MDRFLEDDAVEEDVRGFIEQLWMSCSAEIDDRWLGTLEVPVTADRAISRIDAIVAWALNEFDGEVKDEVPQEVHTADSEPVPAMIDPWARGVVAVRKPPSLEREDSQYRGDPDSPDRTPSVSSFASRSTTRSSRMGSSRGAKSQAGGYNSTFKQEEMGPEIFDIDEDEDFSMLNKTGDLFNKMLRSMKNAGKTDDQEDEEDEFRQLQAEVDRLTTEAKGKKFTFDAMGQPIYINPVKAEKLPRFSVDPNLKVANKPDPADEERPSSSSNKNKEKKTGGTRKIRGMGSRDIDSSFFTATKDLATAMAEVEPALLPGVSMRIGERIREGPAIPEDPKKMSRKKFMSRGGTGMTEGSMMASRGDGGMSPTSDLEDSMYVEEDNLPISMLQQKYKDLDPMEGGRKVSPGKSELLDYDNGMSGPRHAQVGDVPVPRKPSATQRSNIKQLSGGPENPGLRDRAAEHASKPPSQLKKLPAPPVGQISNFNSLAESQTGFLDSPSSIGGGRMQNSLADGGRSPSGGASMSSRTSKANKGKVKHERKDLTRALF